jgi:hypothetical protein
VNNDVTPLGAIGRGLAAGFVGEMRRQELPGSVERRGRFP